MTPMMNGFTDELVKVALAGPVKDALKLTKATWEGLSPGAKAVLKQMGVVGAGGAAVHHLVARDPSISGSLRAGAGIGVGDVAGQHVARQMGAGPKGQMLGGLAGALILSSKLRKRERERKQPGPMKVQIVPNT